MATKFAVYYYGIVFIFSVISLFFIDTTYDVAKIGLYSKLTISLVVVYIIRKLFMKNSNWIDPNLMFMVGFLIVFVQVPLKVVYGMPVDEVKFGANFMNYEYVALGSLLSLLGLASFLLGSCIRFHYGSVNIYKENVTPPMLQRLVRLFTLLSFLFFSIFISVTFGKAYGESIGAVAELSYSMMNLFTIILLILAGFSVCSEDVKTILQYVVKQDKVILLYFAMISLHSINMGTRASFVTWLIAFVTPYFCMCKRMSFKTFMMGLFMGMFLVAWSAAFRTSEKVSIGEKFNNSLKVLDNMNRLSENYSGSIYLAMTYELEKSYLSYNELLRYTDEKGCEYGKSWVLQALSAVFPLSGNVVKKVFGLVDEELVSSVALSELVSKSHYGAGMGSSIVGDIYYNFGRWGIILFMGLLGYFVKIITVSTTYAQYSLQKIAFLSVFSYLVFNSFLICRNEYYLGWTIYIRILIVFGLVGYYYSNIKKCCYE